jgi:hypothetical protein
MPFIINYTPKSVNLRESFAIDLSYLPGMAQLYMAKKKVVCTPREKTCNWQHHNYHLTKTPIMISKGLNQWFCSLYLKEDLAS